MTPVWRALDRRIVTTLLYLKAGYVRRKSAQFGKTFLLSRCIYFLFCSTSPLWNINKCFSKNSVSEVEYVSKRKYSTKLNRLKWSFPQSSLWECSWGISESRCALLSAPVLGDHGALCGGACQRVLILGNTPLKTTFLCSPSIQQCAIWMSPWVHFSHLEN